MNEEMVPSAKSILALALLCFLVLVSKRGLMSLIFLKLNLGPSFAENPHAYKQEMGI